MLVETRETQSVYQPRQAGLIFPQEPVFESVAHERQHRKERLAAACRLFALHGFSHGMAGHLTVRDPEFPELFWTNPVCVPFSMVKVSNLIQVDRDGKVVQGRHAVNRAGYVLHSAIHDLNPDIVASCHAHTVHGAAWASMGRPLDPISQDACTFYGDHVVVTDSAGAVPVDDGSGHPIAKAFAKVKAVIHQNHGLLTASRHSIDDACWNFIELEHLCRMQLMVDACSTPPKMVPHEHAVHTHKHLGGAFHCWLHFQALYAEVSRTQPDLFD